MTLAYTRHGFEVLQESDKRLSLVFDRADFTIDSGFAWTLAGLGIPIGIVLVVFGGLPGILLSIASFGATIALVLADLWYNPRETRLSLYWSTGSLDVTVRYRFRPARTTAIAFDSVSAIYYHKQLTLINGLYEPCSLHIFLNGCTWIDLARHIPLPEISELRRLFRPLLEKTKSGDIDELLERSRKRTKNPKL